VAIPAGAGLVVEVRGPRIDVAGVGPSAREAEEDVGVDVLAEQGGDVGLTTTTVSPVSRRVSTTWPSPLDGHLTHSGEAQPAHQLAQPGPGGVDEVTVPLLFTIATALSTVAQSGPPVTSPGGYSGREVAIDVAVAGEVGEGGMSFGMSSFGEAVAGAPVGRVLGRDSRIAHCSALTLALSPCRRSARPR
jgi:hypothetical protein